VEGKVKATSKDLLSAKPRTESTSAPRTIPELTLAPSGDEILPVRSQELQTNAFIQNKLKNIS